MASYEEWRQVAGYEGLYTVSSLGNVHSTARPGTKGGLLTPKEDRHGYYQVGLYRDGAALNWFIHHLVLNAFAGLRPAGAETLHGPGGRHDNRLLNLAWGTPAKNNIEDKSRDHVTIRGEKHPQAKLTWEEVCQIRELLAEGAAMTQLAADYGVAKGTIGAIKYGRSWKYPPETW